MSAILQELHDGEKVEVDSHFIKATKKQVIDFVHKLVFQIEQECHKVTDILLVDSDEQSVTSVDLKSQLLTMMGKLNAPVIKGYPYVKREDRSRVDTFLKAGNSGKIPNNGLQHSIGCTAYKRRI